MIGQIKCWCCRRSQKGAVNQSDKILHLADAETQLKLFWDIFLKTEYRYCIVDPQSWVIWKLKIKYLRLKQQWGKLFQTWPTFTFSPPPFVEFSAEWIFSASEHEIESLDLSTCGGLLFLVNTSWQKNVLPFFNFW